MLIQQEKNTPKLRPGMDEFGGILGYDSTN